MLSPLHHILRDFGYRIAFNHVSFNENLVNRDNDPSSVGSTTVRAEPNVSSDVSGVSYHAPRRPDGSGCWLTDPGSVSSVRFGARFRRIMVGAHPA